MKTANYICLMVLWVLSCVGHAAQQGESFTARVVSPSAFSEIDSAAEKIRQVALDCLSAAPDITHRHQTDRLSPEKMLLDYCTEMNNPKPFLIRKGQSFKNHQRELRRRILQCIGLWPLPKRVPLDVHQSEPLDHQFCTIRRIHYQLWPDVYSSGLLYMPKNLPEMPAAAMLCPHGHWPRGNANRTPQTRCLVFAEKGFVVFSPVMHHYEDLALGISHQTQMVWNNMRALDYLESLPEVDKSRIGCAGCSGGAMQTLMLVGLDDRVKAASIVGWGVDFQEVLYPAGYHCGCHQFPNIMRYTDHPEIGALGLPAAIQYLTMDDTTRNFEFDNFPTMQELYAANGVPDRVDCKYWSADHGYHRPMRERTYWWMERWLRGAKLAKPESEPDDVHRKLTFAPEILLALSAQVPQHKGLPEISSVYLSERGYQLPTISSQSDWQNYRQLMTETLKNLLGEHVQLPRIASAIETISAKVEEGLVLECADYPSEGRIRIPTVILRREDVEGKLPVVVICHEAGAERLLDAEGLGSLIHLARKGSLVVLPDVRFVGKLSVDRDVNGRLNRNALVWGRPILGMTCTDIRSLLDALSLRADSDMSQIRVVAANSGGLATAVLFAAALDTRITSIDVDFKNCCFEKRNLPVVPFVLQHGDILQWAALMGDRTLTLRNIPAEAGEASWLSKVFNLMDNPKGLKIERD